MLEILGRLEQLDKAAQIRIADELFGGAGGERFVELLAQGEAGIRRTITEANALGIVMDDELIAKAAEVDRQFNLIATTVGTALKSAIVSAAASLADFIDGFREFQNQRDRTLQARQTEIMREKAEQAAGLDNLPAGRNGERGRAIINLRLRELDEEENQIIAELERRTEQTWRPKADTWTPPATAPGPAPAGRQAAPARPTTTAARCRRSPPRPPPSKRRGRRSPAPRPRAKPIATCSNMRASAPSFWSPRSARAERSRLPCRLRSTGSREHMPRPARALSRPPSACGPWRQPDSAGRRL